MKTIENKKTELKDDKDGYMDYKDLITFCMNQTPQGGLGLQDMRDRFRISNAIEKGNGKIKLEDSDVENLKGIVGNVKWGSYHKDLLEFLEMMEQL